MNIFTVEMWVLYHNQDKEAWSPIKPEGHNAEISQGWNESSVWDAVRVRTRGSERVTDFNRNWILGGEIKAWLWREGSCEDRSHKPHPWVAVKQGGGLEWVWRTRQAGQPWVENSLQTQPPLWPDTKPSTVPRRPDARISGSPGPAEGSAGQPFHSSPTIEECPSTILPLTLWDKGFLWLLIKFSGCMDNFCCFLKNPFP